MDFDRHSMLVIVANACVLKKVSELLATTGAAVYGTSCAAEGLRLLGTCRPDLIVMDHALSDPDWLEGSDRVWGSARVPILFLSVLRVEYLETSDLGDCAWATITMPFDPEILLAHARAALKSEGPVAPRSVQGASEQQGVARQSCAGMHQPDFQRGRGPVILAMAA